jgi:hypothetical protein
MVSKEGVQTFRLLDRLKTSGVLHEIMLMRFLFFLFIHSTGWPFWKI